MRYIRILIIILNYYYLGCNSQYDLDDYLDDPAIVVIGHVVDNEIGKVYIYNTNTRVDGQSYGNIQQLSNIQIDSGYVEDSSNRYRLIPHKNLFNTQIEYYIVENFIPKPLDSVWLHVHVGGNHLGSFTTIPEIVEINGSNGFEIKKTDDAKSTVNYSINFREYPHDTYIIIESILFLNGEIRGKISDIQRKITRGGSESVSIEIDFNRNYNVDSALVTVYNLNEQYFTYLTKVEDVKNGYQSIFSSSMVDLPSNIRNGFGYFTGITKTMVIIKNED